MEEKTTNQDILGVNRFLLPSLPKSEKKASKALAENAEDIIHMTVTEFAELAGCSQASIIRFCKRFDVDGFPEFKMKLMMALKDEANYPVVRHEVKRTDSMREILEKVFLLNIQTLKDTLNLFSEDYEAALDSLSRARMVHFFGIGDAAVPAQLAGIKFLRLGIPCSVNVDADLQLMTAENMKLEDVAIAISYSGRTRTVVEAMRIAKAKGAKTICITKMKKSPLIKYCDAKLFTATTDISMGKEVIARRVAEQAIIEALYLGLANRMEPDIQDNIGRISDTIKFNKL